LCCEAGRQPVQGPAAQHESKAMGLTFCETNAAPG
jgi:hypothetical protein